MPREILSPSDADIDSINSYTPFLPKKKEAEALELKQGSDKDLGKFELALPASSTEFNITALKSASNRTHKLNTPYPDSFNPVGSTPVAFTRTQNGEIKIENRRLQEQKNQNLVEQYQRVELEKAPTQRHIYSIDEVNSILYGTPQIDDPHGYYKTVQPAGDNRFELGRAGRKLEKPPLIARPQLETINDPNRVQNLDDLNVVSKASAKWPPEIDPATGRAILEPVTATSMIQKVNNAVSDQINKGKQIAEKAKNIIPRVGNFIDDESTVDRDNVNDAISGQINKVKEVASDYIAKYPGNAEIIDNAPIDTTTNYDIVSGNWMPLKDGLAKIGETITTTAGQTKNTLKNATDRVGQSISTGVGMGVMRTQELLNRLKKEGKTGDDNLDIDDQQLDDEPISDSNIPEAEVIIEQLTPRQESMSRMRKILEEYNSETNPAKRGKLEDEFILLQDKVMELWLYEPNRSDKNITNKKFVEDLIDAHIPFYRNEPNEQYQPYLFREEVTYLFNEVYSNNRYNHQTAMSLLDKIQSFKENNPDRSIVLDNLISVIAAPVQDATLGIVLSHLETATKGSIEQAGIPYVPDQQRSISSDNKIKQILELGFIPPDGNPAKLPIKPLKVVFDIPEQNDTHLPIIDAPRIEQTANSQMSDPVPDADQKRDRINELIRQAQERYNARRQLESEDGTNRKYGPETQTYEDHQFPQNENNGRPENGSNGNGIYPTNGTGEAALNLTDESTSQVPMTSQQREEIVNDIKNQFPSPESLTQEQKQQIIDLIRTRFPQVDNVDDYLADENNILQRVFEPEIQEAESTFNRAELSEKTFSELGQRLEQVRKGIAQQLDNENSSLQLGHLNDEYAVLQDMMIESWFKENDEIINEYTKELHDRPEEFKQLLDTFFKADFSEDRITNLLYVLNDADRFKRGSAARQHEREIADKFIKALKPALELLDGGKVFLRYDLQGKSKQFLDGLHADYDRNESNQNDGSVINVEGVGFTSNNPLSKSVKPLLTFGPRAGL